MCVSFYYIKKKQGVEFLNYNIQTEAGFEEMYNEYFPKIYNFVFYHILSREDTEDIVSDVFFKVVKHKSAFDSGKAGLGTWIFNVAKNTLIDYYRKQKMEFMYEKLESSATIEFEQQLKQITSEKRKVIFGELTQLKEKERIIIYYKFFRNYNNRQIAMILQMNESTVGTVLSRTLKKLRTDTLQELLEE